MWLCLIVGEGASRWGRIKGKKKLWEEGKYSRIDTMPIWIEGGGGGGGVEESRIELIENKLIYATSTLLYSTPLIQTDHNCKLFVIFFFSL